MIRLLPVDPLLEPIQCRGGDSNPYLLRDQILSLARLPISPPRLNIVGAPIMARFGPMTSRRGIQAPLQEQDCMESLPHDEREKIPSEALLAKDGTVALAEGIRAPYSLRAFPQ